MKYLFFQILILVAFQINLHSQNFDDSYQPRKDQYDHRQEGIKEKFTNVAGDRILLLSALINTFQNITPIPDTMHLSFYAKNQIKSSVSITDDKSYFVDPENMEWGPGLATFIWPTIIMQRNNISPKNLYVRTILTSTTEHFIFPGCLYYRNLPTKVNNYTFTIIPQRGMELQYWIIDAASDSLILTGLKQKIGGNRKYSISWDCLDKNNNPVPEGKYILKIKGEYHDILGQKHTVSTSYNFFHKINLVN